MTHILLHAGMPKTGTSYLQQMFDDNREVLSQEKVLYPGSGRYADFGPCHHKFFLSFAHGSDAWPLTPFAEPSTSGENSVECLQKEVLRTGSDAVILSSEMLYELSRDVAVLKRIKKELGYGSVSILLVLRRQGDFLESMYAQRVRGIQKYKGSPKSHLMEFVNLGLLDYDQQVFNLVSVFGREHVYLCWYDDVKHDLLEPFRAILGRDLPLDVAVRRTNVRPTWATITVCRWLNYVPGHYRKFKTTCLHLVRRIENIFSKYGLRFFLERWFRPYTSGELKYINQKYQDCNHRIGNMSGVTWLKK